MRSPIFICFCIYTLSGSSGCSSLVGSNLNKGHKKGTGKTEERKQKQIRPSQNFYNVLQNRQLFKTGLYSLRRYPRFIQNISQNSWQFHFISHSSFPQESIRRSCHVVCPLSKPFLVHLIYIWRMMSFDAEIYHANLNRRTNRVRITNSICPLQSAASRPQTVGKRQRKLTNNRRLSSSADKERWRQVVNYRQQEIKLLHTSENRWAFQFESSFSPVCEGWAYASWVEREQSRTELTGRRFGTVWCIHRTQPRLSIPNNLCLTSSMLAGQSAFGSTFLRPWLRPQPRPFYFIHRRSRLRFPSSNSWTKTEGRENARTRPGDPGRRRWCLWLGS